MSGLRTCIGWAVGYFKDEGGVAIGEDEAAFAARVAAKCRAVRYGAVWIEATSKRRAAVGGMGCRVVRTYGRTDGRMHLCIHLFVCLSVHPATYESVNIHYCNEHADTIPSRRCTTPCLATARPRSLLFSTRLSFFLLFFLAHSTSIHPLSVCTYVELASSSLFPCARVSHRTYTPTRQRPHVRGQSGGRTRSFHRKEGQGWLAGRPT